MSIWSPSSIISSAPMPSPRRRRRSRRCWNRRHSPGDRCGARLRQAGIAAMGGLVQDPRRLLAAEAADAGRGQDAASSPTPPAISRKGWRPPARRSASRSPSSCRSTRRPPSATRRPAMARASCVTDHGERAREEVAAEKARADRRGGRAGAAASVRRSGDRRRPGRRRSRSARPAGGQGRQGRPAVLLGRRRRADRRRGARLPLSVAGDRDHRRRAGRLQRHGHVAGAWRDRDDAARAELDLRRADGAPAGRRAVRGGAAGRRRASPSTTHRCAGR